MEFYTETQISYQLWTLFLKVREGKKKKENSRDVSTRTDDVQTPSEIISRRQRYPSSGTHKPVCYSASTEARSFPTSFFVASHPLCSAQPVDRRAYGGEGGWEKRKKKTKKKTAAVPGTLREHMK